MFCKIFSEIPKVANESTTFYYLYRFYQTQTHYDVLNLPKNCTSKQIKSAFIKLSKEHHPDVNKSKQSHARFQQINEAYKILGKPATRKHYDSGLWDRYEFSYARKYNTGTYEHRGRNPYHDPLFWVNRDRAQDEFYYNRSYYGINSVPRLSNGAVMMFCIFFSLIGVGLQYLAITKSATFKREILIQKSLEAETLLNETRDIASANGNAVQLEALKTKLLGKIPKEVDNK